MKKHLWAIMYTAALLGFTVYVASDTFLISRSYNTNATEMNTGLFDFPESVSSSDSSASNETESGFTETSTSTAESSAASTHKRPSRPGSSTVSSVEQSSAASVETPPEETSVPEPAESTEVDTPPEETSVPEPAESTEPETPPDDPEESHTPGTVILDDTHYQDDNISISLSQQRVYDTEVYIADIKLSSAQYLKSAFAFDTYGKNVTAVTSEIAAAHNAIFAVNGDYYGIRESGFVIRNGIVYRDTPKEQVLAVYADGSMEVIDPYSVSADELVERRVWQAFSFGPALVNNGVVAVDVNSEVKYSKTSNPRTAIGMIEPLHYVFVVSDGRTSESEGLSLYQLGEFMQGLGAVTAYNLDGGGSSSMVFNGRIINKPTSNGDRISERSISDIVYIG